MHETLRITVRDTPVDLLRAGAGPPLLHLHGAEVMPPFREDAHVDETAGVGR